MQPFAFHPTKTAYKLVKSCLFEIRLRTRTRPPQVSVDILQLLHRPGQRYEAPIDEAAQPVVHLYCWGKSTPKPGELFEPDLLTPGEYPDHARFFGPAFLIYVEAECETIGDEQDADGLITRFMYELRFHLAIDPDALRHAHKPGEPGAFERERQKAIDLLAGNGYDTWTVLPAPVAQEAPADEDEDDDDDEVERRQVDIEEVIADAEPLQLGVRPLLLLPAPEQPALAADDAPALPPPDDVDAGDVDQAAEGAQAVDLTTCPHCMETADPARDVLIEVEGQGRWHAVCWWDLDAAVRHDLVDGDHDRAIESLPEASVEAVAAHVLRQFEAREWSAPMSVAAAVDIASTCEVAGTDGWSDLHVVVEAAFKRLIERGQVVEVLPNTIAPLQPAPSAVEPEPADADTAAADAAELAELAAVAPAHEPTPDPNQWGYAEHIDRFIERHFASRGNEPYSGVHKFVDATRMQNGREWDGRWHELLWERLDAPDGPCKRDERGYSLKVWTAPAALEFPPPPEDDEDEARPGSYEKPKLLRAGIDSAIAWLPKQLDEVHNCQLTSFRVLGEEWASKTGCDTHKATRQVIAALEYLLRVRKVERMGDLWGVLSTIRVGKKTDNEVRFDVLSILRCTGWVAAPDIYGMTWVVSAIEDKARCDQLGFGAVRIKRALQELLEQGIVEMQGKAWRLVRPEGEAAA